MVFEELMLNGERGLQKIVPLNLEERLGILLTNENDKTKRRRNGFAEVIIL